MGSQETEAADKTASTAANQRPDQEELLGTASVMDESGEKKKDYYIVESLKDIPVKTLLIIGKTGTGKSALCNRISGQKFNSDIFPVSGEATSCTQSTAMGLIQFNGDKEKMIGLVDTIGFDDPNNDTDIG